MRFLNLFKKKDNIDTDTPTDDKLMLMASMAMIELNSRGVSLGNLSDGYHTYNELYHHRAVLFATICKRNPMLAWKSKKHHDGSMYDGMFIVGVNTPAGQATYHYDIDPYWDKYFGDVEELENAPEWDGHTPNQAIERIFTL